MWLERTKGWLRGQGLESQTPNTGNTYRACERKKILSSHLRNQAQRKAGTHPMLHTLLSVTLGLESQTLSGPCYPAGINSFIGHMRSQGLGRLLKIFF